MNFWIILSPSANQIWMLVIGSKSFKGTTGRRLLSAAPWWSSLALEIILGVALKKEAEVMTSRKFEPLSKVSSGALCPVSESTADFKNNKKRSLDLISFKNKKNQQKQKTQKTMLRIPSVSLQCAKEFVCLQRTFYKTVGNLHVKGLKHTWEILHVFLYSNHTGETIGGSSLNLHTQCDYSNSV